MAKSTKEMIEKDLEPRLKDLEKAHTNLKPQTQKVIDDLSDAIRAKNRPLIERHLADLTAHMPSHAALLTRVNQLAGELRTLKAADAQDSKAIEKVTKPVGELQGKLERNYKSLKSLQDKAADAAQEGGASKAAMAEWADMENFLSKAVEGIRLRQKAMDMLNEMARVAVQERDEATLAQAQKKNEERTGWKPTRKDVESRFASFCTKCKSAGLSKDVLDQLERDTAKFKKQVEEFKELDTKIEGRYHAIKVQKIADLKKPQPLNPKKAATILKIPSSHVVDLEKALKATGSSRVSKLDAIASDLKMKTKGKDMITALEKANLL